MDDINLIKPEIGETTRVLLRRVPWKVLIDKRYQDSQELVESEQSAETVQDEQTSQEEEEIMERFSEIGNKCIHFNST